MSSMMQRTVLNAIGIEWYVRCGNVQDITPPVASNAELANAGSLAPTPSQDSVEPRIQSLAPSSLTSLLDEPKQKNTTELNKQQPTPSDKHTELPVEAPQATKPRSDVQFNWLVADVGRLVFVCDIKPPRLNAVWHSAAIELLGDIAIAMQQTGSVRSQYFNWPLEANMGMVMSDLDLDGLVGSFLERAESEQPRLYLLLGEAAEEIAKPVLEGQQCVLSPSLGELFKRADAKKQLWQTLKPLR